jgi:hypothetical protein
MKTKIILMAALVSATAMSANAGVRFGFSLGLPLPVVIKTPVVVAAPVVPAPPAVVVETVPACPGVDYVWTPGYWSYRATGYTWVPGVWFHRPVHVGHEHFHGDYRR